MTDVGPPRRITAEPPGWEGTRASHDRAIAVMVADDARLPTSPTCVCGHVEDEHAGCDPEDGDPDACCVFDCGCPFYEWDGVSGDQAEVGG